MMMHDFDPLAQRARELEPREANAAVEVLREAFRDYPVMRYVLGQPDDDGLRKMIDFFVRTRFLRGEPVLGVDVDGSLAGVALVSDPTGHRSPGEVAVLREALWSALGRSARVRYEGFGAAYQPLILPEPHIHLNMVGVRDAFRGTGLGRLLLDRVHRLSMETPGSRGVTLTTESEPNVALYEHVGYRVTGTAEIAPGLRTWAMFRAND